jgi:hypothetical protein
MPSSVSLKGRSSLLPSLGRATGAGNQKYGVKSAVRQGKWSMGKKGLIGGGKSGHRGRTKAGLQETLKTSGSHQAGVSTPDLGRGKDA